MTNDRSTPLSQNSIIPVVSAANLGLTIWFATFFIFYPPWEKKEPGKVLARAKALGINTFLVATNSGRTAFEALEALGPGKKIIAVSHVTGFIEPNHQELSQRS